MIILLIISGITYNITNYVDINSLSVSDAIDETLGSGGFSIPYIKFDSIGFDMSKPIPRFSKVVIEDDETWYFYVSEDLVVLKNKVSGLYEHQVTLIEPTKILQKRTIPDQTIRQPQGDINNFEYVINSVDESEYQQFSSFTSYYGFRFDSTRLTVPFLNGLSSDTSVIDGMTLKEIREYVIYTQFTLWNESGTIDADIDVELLVGGVVQKAENYIISNRSFFGNPRYKTKYISITYTPSVVNEVVSMRVKENSAFNDAYITDASIKIQTQIGEATDKYTLDQVVDKVLRSVQVFALGEEDNEFILADETRARISDMISPEFTWQGYTLYDALQEIASYVAAQVYLGQDDFNTIYFYFYDNVAQELGITYYENEHQLLSNDYVTALEINAQNVIKEDTNRFVKHEPYRNGYMSIRLNADGFGQITDNNSAITLKQGIYRPISLLVRGLEFTMYDGATPVVFADTDIWDISQFVVEQTRYNALLNTSSANTRTGTLDKGNTMYYVQGQNRIMNLGYNDVLRPPAWATPDPLNYAVVEAILCKAQLDNPTYTFSSEYLVSVDIFDLEFSVSYIPYAQSRVTVYKDSSQDEQTEVVAYFNEQAQLNDMNTLGNIAQKHANRRGNQISRYKGLAYNYGNLLRLGQSNAVGEKLTRFTIEYTPTYKVLGLEYTDKYTNISSYRGVPSAYRQWEVPNTNTVTRFDKYTEFLYLSETSISVDTIINNLSIIWHNFRADSVGVAISYAKISIDYDGEGYTKTVESPVDRHVYGKTSSFVIKMYDNYSAGAYIDTQGSVEYQRDARYTDDNGRIRNVKYEIYSTIQTFALGNDYADEYPQNDVTPTAGFKVSELAYNINKDAGEIMGLVQEFVFKSNTPNILVFNGFAKYCGLMMASTEITARPFLLKKGYFPNNENIEQSQLILLGGRWVFTTGIGNAHTTRITSPIGQYEGYVWIETRTFEPIFAVKTSDFDSTTGTTEYSKTIYLGG